MEFAVGHGTATRAAIVAGNCHKVSTTRMPEAEVERVEPSAMSGVELGMEALASMADAATLRARLAPIVTEYRAWIASQRANAPNAGLQGEVSHDLLQRASLAADRIKAGLALLDDPLVLRAFLLTNRTMAMAARQRRSQEQNIQPAAADAPEWRPFQLAFLVMNLRAFVSPNFTEWAHQRNVEAGVLIRNRNFANQLIQHFEGLIAAQHVRRLPGF